MARSTGIEITETTVRVADIDGSGKKYRIHGAAEVPIAVDDEGRRGAEQIQQAVRAAMKAAKARRDTVILGLPSSRVIIREIVIPFTDAAQIRKVIKFESESHLPSGNIEDVIVDFHKVGETGPRSRVLIIAVQKAVLKEYLGILGRVGIDPAEVDLDTAALFSLSRLIPGLDGEDEAAANIIIDVGDTTTNVMVTTGPRLRMVRSMRLGAETLTRTLSQDLGIDRQEAKTVTARILGTGEHPFAPAGEVESREPSTALTAVQLKHDIIRDKDNDLARRIVNEVRRSLSSLQLEGRVAGIWITGTASRSPGLERGLAETLRVPVRPLDVLHGAEHDLPPEAALFAGVPIGLALKGLDHDPLRLDFRQEELRFTRRFERIRNPLVFAEAFLLVLFCFLAINEYNTQRFQKADTEYVAHQGLIQVEDLVYGRARKEAKTASMLGFENAEAVEKAVKDIQRAPPAQQLSSMLGKLSKSMDAVRKDYGVDFGDDEKSPEQEARSALFRLDQFLGVFEKVKDQIGRVMIDRMDVSSIGITWSMRVQKTDAFTVLKAEFEKLPEFRGASEGKSSSRGDMQNLESAKLEFKTEN